MIEIREEAQRPDHSQVYLVANGRSLTAEIGLDYGQRQVQQTAAAPIANFEALRCITIDLPALPAPLLKVWLHHLPIEGGSVGLPAQVTLTGATWPAPIVFQIDVAHDQQIVRLPAPCQRVEIAFAKRK
ncbi:MAG: hypothetical protein R2867_42905 [Caldilineaceae bacterium]